MISILIIFRCLAFVYVEVVLLLSFFFVLLFLVFFCSNSDNVEQRALSSPSQSRFAILESNTGVLIITYTIYVGGS